MSSGAAGAVTGVAVACLIVTAACGLTVLMTATVRACQWLMSLARPRLRR